MYECDSLCLRMVFCCKDVLVMSSGPDTGGQPQAKFKEDSNGSTSKPKVRYFTTEKSCYKNH